MKKCKVCGREIKGRPALGMCNKHYRQYKKYGKVLDSNPRTRFDPNEIVEYEDHAEIILYDKDCEEVARALIDLDDVDNVKCYKWCLGNLGYVKYVKEDISLHRLIMDCPKDMVVDHINHNPLDNRKSNLRICTQQQNSINRSIRSDNNSGIAGVLWNESRKKWIAYIRYNKKGITLGYYNTKEEAIEARKQAEIDLFGEYRNQDEEDVS